MNAQQVLFHAPGWLILLPLVASISCVLIAPRLRSQFSLLMLAPMGMLLAGLVLSFGQAGPVSVPLAGWRAPLGIALLVDGPALGMLVISFLVAAACGLHASDYLRHHQEAADHFWPLMWFLWAALNTIWMSSDIFNLYVGLELLGLAAVGLVALQGHAEALAAAMRYLLAALLGSLAYLIGVALLYGSHGSLWLAELALAQHGGLGTGVALILMTLGLMLKTALFPLHAWLPPAHGGALSPVSALLSALVIKASFFIILRLWLSLSPPGQDELATVLGVLGALAVVWGGWKALRQTHLKPLIAYSTVAQIGYLFLFFPLAFGTSPEAARLAWDGTMLLIMSHALAKAAMFLAAGNLVLAIGSGKITDLAGIGRYRQFSLLSLGIAGVSIMGLPPSGGFGAKWLLLQSAMNSGGFAWGAILIIGGLLSAAYLFRIFRAAFIEGPKRDNFRSPSIRLEISAFALALSSLIIGLLANTPLTWMRIGVLPGVWP